MSAQNKIVFLLFMMLNLSLFSQNQNIKFERIASEYIRLDRGLSQNSVRTIIQDRYGFLWFGTWDGLNRYDGYNFTVFRSGKEQNGIILTNPSIRALNEDVNGLIWIGTENGLNCYDRSKRKVTHFYHDENDDNSLADNYINHIVSDRNGLVWIATANGLSCYNPPIGRFKNYHLNSLSANSLSSDSVKHLTIDPYNRLWISTQKGLNSLNIKTNRFSHWFHDDNKKSISSDNVNITYFENGLLWVGTDNGLDCIYLASGNIKHFGFTNKNGSNGFKDIRAIYRDTKKILWIGSYGAGLYVLDERSGKYHSYTYDTKNNSSLSDDYIQEIFEDNNGVLWIGTAWKGVNKIDRKNRKFEHYCHTSNDTRSINSNLVWAISEDLKENIWIGTENGINIFNPQTGDFKFIRYEYNKPSCLSSNSVRVLYFDKFDPDILWIGYLSSGITRYNLKTGQYHHYQHELSNPFSLSTNSINLIKRDLHGVLWVGTQNGLNRFDDKTRKFYRYFADYKHGGLSQDNIYALYEDREGIMWIGTQKGLNKYNRFTGKFKSILNIPLDSKSLPSDYIFDIFESHDGFLWLGTMGGGLIKYNKYTGESISYSEKEGLPNNVVYSIISDKRNRFWMSTNFGISCFDPKSKAFLNFDVKDGIQSSEFNYNAALKSSDGYIYFGGMNGFNRFNPEVIDINNRPPQIAIVNFKLFNQAYPYEIKRGDTLTLNYNENSFSFEFSALDFTNPAKNKYTYTLSGYEKKWNYADAQHRFAEYTKVPAGTYHFVVKGTNSDGVWNKEGIVITLIIKPAWYNTLFFKGIVIVLITSLIWILVYLRIRKLKKEHEVERKMLEIEKQMFEVEQHSLRLQMNPHFIFNSLNSIQGFVLENDTDGAIVYLSKFSHLMRLILNNSKESFIPLRDELKAISYYIELEQLRFDFKFDFRINIDERIDTDFIGIPPMLIQPYIENAVIHGMINKKGKGNIQINLSMEEKYLICNIIDDGIGREASGLLRAKTGLRHKPKGMLITKERLDLLNKQLNSNLSVYITDLFDESSKSTGTKVTLKIIYVEL